MAADDFDRVLKSITQANSQMTTSLRLIKELETGLRAVGSGHPLAGLLADLKSGVAELEAFKNKQASSALKILGSQASANVATSSSARILKSAWIGLAIPSFVIANKSS